MLEKIDFEEFMNRYGKYLQDKIDGMRKQNPCIIFSDDTEVKYKRYIADCPHLKDIVRDDYDKEILVRAMKHDDFFNTIMFASEEADRYRNEAINEEINFEQFCELSKYTSIKVIFLLRRDDLLKYTA